MPKRGVIAGELGFIIVDNFPRASEATIHYLDGKVEVIEAGEAEKAFVYEVEDMNQCILNKVKMDTVELSMDVMEIMDEVRARWGIRYPFE